METNHIRIFAKELYTPTRIINNAFIEIVDGIISEIRETHKIPKDADEQNIISGDIISPGHFDIHIHGCCGVDFLNADENGIKQLLEGALKDGTTEMLATITIAKSDTDLSRFKKLIELIAKHKDYKSGAKITGIHLEGPYINPKKKGGFPLEFIKPASLKEFTEVSKIISDFCGEGFFKLITIAPEIEGGDAIVESALKSGIRVSLGHSELSYHTALKYFKRGVDHITHIFNAMDGLHHREPGIIGAALDSSDIYIQIIPDGIHLHPAILRMLYALKKPEKLILISDASAPSGFDEGAVIEAFNGKAVFTIKDGAIRNQDGTLTGSALLMNRAVKTFSKFTSAPLRDIFIMSSLSPLLSVSQRPVKEIIAVGKPANILIFEKELNIKSVIYGSKIFDFNKNHTSK